MVKPVPRTARKILAYLARPEIQAALLVAIILARRELQPFPAKPIIDDPGL